MVAISFAGPEPIVSELHTLFPTSLKMVIGKFSDFSDAPKAPIGRRDVDGKNNGVSGSANDSVTQDDALRPDNEVHHRALSKRTVFFFAPFLRNLAFAQNDSLARLREHADVATSVVTRLPLFNF